MTIRSLGVLGLLLMLVAQPMAQQVTGVQSTKAAAFLGTWAILMTEPLGFRGAHETLKISDNNGVLAASVQSEQSPPINVTGMLKDGDVLFLTVTRFENGQPIWAVIALKLDGDTMTMHQMLEPSRDIKIGSGKRQ